MSTVFLSYSSSDVALAVRIRDLLIAHGYPAVFRDKDPEEGIPAGARWADEIFLSLDIHDIVVFLATAASLASPWCHTELAVAVARRKYVVQISTEPVKVHPVLSATQSIGPIADVEALIDQLVAGLSRVGLGPGDVAAWDPNESPYPGLERLTERHAAVLFGREREVGAVLDQLSRPQPLPVLVVGPSGSGKSSLVRAGVVPRLKRQVHTVVLPVVEPGADPLGHLAAEVEKADAKSDARRLVAEPDALSLAIDRLIAGSEGGRVVLVLDQAEDLISRASQGSATELVRRLRAIDRERLAIIVVLRSASLDPWIRNPDLASLTPGDPVWVRPLDRSALREVIVGPARLTGIKFDPEELVETILDDAGEGMALPLLAALMEELTRGHSRRNPAVVTVDRYTSIGPVAHVIERRAEAAVHDIRAKVGQLEPAVVDAYLRLVEIDDSGQIVRSELDAKGLPEDVRSMFDVLEEYRLVTRDRVVAGTATAPATNDEDGAGASTVANEVLMAVHEEVFRAWPALKTALAARSPDLQIRTWLRRDAETWSTSGRGQVVLAGGRLDLALDWSDRNPRDMTDLVREYLDAGVGQRRIGRIARLATVALAGILAVVGVFAYQAVQARNEEEASRLATDARANFDSRLDLGLLLALEARARSADLQAQSMPLVGLSRGAGPRSFARLGEDLDEGELDATGSRAVLAMQDGVTLWDVPTSRGVATTPVTATATSISADGSTVAVGRASEDGASLIEVSRWPSLAPVMTCDIDGAINDLRLSPTGDFVVVVAEDEGDAAGLSSVSAVATSDCDATDFEGIAGSVSDIDVDVDRVALGIEDAGAGIWDPNDGTGELRPFEGTIRAVALGDGDQLAALSGDGSLLVWDEGEEVPRQFPVFDRNLAGVDVAGSKLRYAPNRTAWIAGSQQGDLREVQADPDFVPKPPIRSLPDAGRAAPGAIVDLAITGSGAVTVDESGRIIAWDLDGRPPLGGQVFSAGRVDLLQARPDGSILAAGPSGAWLLDGQTGEIQGNWLAPSEGACGSSPITAISSGSDGWAIGTGSGNVLVSSGSVDDLVEVMQAPCPSTPSPCSLGARSRSPTARVP